MELEDFVTYVDGARDKRPVLPFESLPHLPRRPSPSGDPQAPFVLNNGIYSVASAKSVQSI